MRVIFKEPGCRERVIELKDGGQAVRQLLGGDVVVRYIADDACIALRKNVPEVSATFNCRLIGVSIYGPLLLMGIRNGAFTDFPLLGSSKKRK